MTAYASYRDETTRSSIINGIKDPCAQGAWARFFDRYAGFVFAVARQRGLRPDEADEVVQSVMAGVVNAMPDFTYDRGRGSFKSWLGKRVHWRIGDQLRKRSDHVPLDAVSADELTDAAPAAGDSLADAEWNDMVIHAALERLRGMVSAEHFSVFHASVIENWETGKVTAVYGVSRDSLYQIRKRVRAVFEELVKAVAAELDTPALP